MTDFFDQLKSRSQGYASLDYEPAGYEASNLVKVDVLLNGIPVDAFSTIMHHDGPYEYGKKMTAKLRELIPRQMFDVPIQAAIGGRIIARETVKAKRKDVLAKCYGGRHHPEAQAAGAAEGGQEADEEHRPRRGAPGGLRLRAAHRLRGCAGRRKTATTGAESSRRERTVPSTLRLSLSVAGSAFARRARLLWRK